MEFKGTKGKWYACCIKDTPHFIFGEKSGLTICKPYMEQEIGDDLYLDEYRANALLISKAPELLEMLDDVKHYLGYDKRILVDELINQATKIN